MKMIILDNLEMLNRIDKSSLVSTYTPAGVIREINLAGSFSKKLSILDLFMEKRIVIFSNGYYAINKGKIKQMMGSNVNR